MKCYRSQVVALTLCGLLLGSSAARPGDETVAETARAKTFVTHSVIGAKVRERLESADKEAFGRLHIDVDADGVVWLRGVTHSLEDARRAVDIARGTESVKSVNSRIRIEP